LSILKLASPTNVADPKNNAMLIKHATKLIETYFPKSMGQVLNICCDKNKITEHPQISILNNKL
jgi:hypothetical protein